MHQITLFQDKKSKNFLGRGHSSLPDPTPSGEGDTPSPHPTPRRLRRLDARTFGARYSAPSAPCLRLKDDLCFRLLLGRADTTSLLRRICPISVKFGRLVMQNNMPITMM